MNIHFGLAVVGALYTCIAMVVTIFMFRERWKGKRPFLIAGACVGGPIIIVVLLFHFLPSVPVQPSVPIVGTAFITEYPQQITIGQHYTIGGNVDLESIPQGWELWAIKIGSDEYWPDHINVNRELGGYWSKPFDDGDGSYMKGDVEFRIVIGLAHPDLSYNWTQWHDNAFETDDWTGIPYEEIPLTDSSLLSPQDSVKLLRPYRCLEVQHEDKCIKYLGE